MTPTETSGETAVLVREQAQPIERSNLTFDELHEQLAFIRQVMAREMKEGQDYGKIPGCGDKPGLFQPGAQKLLLTFQLTPHVKKEVLRELPHPSIFGHREYEFTISVRSKTGREWDGVGTCSTFESKYRYRKSSRKCPTCGKETIFKDKKPNGGFYCWTKKGGCGAQFAANDTTITGQEEGKADNENPAEFWNTVRKMAFKRAIVHASINATNTSELWSQDLEDLPQSQSLRQEYFEEGTTERLKETGPPDDLSFENAPQSVAGVPTKHIVVKDAIGGDKAPPQATTATTKTRSWAIGKIGASVPGARREVLYQYMLALKWITADNTVEAWPLDKVPTNGAELQKLLLRLGEFEAEQRAKEP